MAIQKLQRYCAYQERCHSEVRTKLLDIKIYGDLLEEVIGELIKDDFLNEQRYAETYAGGKFRIKKWGKQKITNHLKSKRVSDYCIQKGLAVIDETEYEKTLNDLVTKYYHERRDSNNGKYQLHKKCMKFCQNKGYEYHLIKKALDGKL